MMNRIKLSVIAERFPEIGIWLVDDKKEPRMWVAQASIGKPLYEGKIPLSIGCNNFVDAVVDGDTWVYVPQYDYRKYISPTYAKEGGRPRTKNTIKPVSTKKPFSFQVDRDIDAWLRSRDNICKYVNSLIRKDMEEQMNIKEQEE